MSQTQNQTVQDPYIDLQSRDPETAVTFQKYANIPTRFASTLKRFLCCHAIFPNNSNELICLKRNRTVKDILEVFFSFHLKIIPIIDEAQHPQKVITQHSLLKLLLPLLSESQKSFNAENIEQFLQRTVNDISEYLEDPIVLPESATAFDAYQLMKKDPFQRVLIVNNLEENILTNIVSETRLIEVLSTLVEDMEDQKTRVEKISLNKNECLCDLIHRDVTAMEAFCRLSSKKLECLGVVDDAGKLLCVLTPTDIKAIGTDLKGLSLLQEPVEVFLQHIRNPHELEAMKPNVIACHLSDTILNMLKKFTYWKVHRIFAVTEEDRYVTDVTLLDVMKYFEDHELRMAAKSSNIL